HRGGMGGAAVRGRLWVCRRRPAGALPEGSDLALCAVRLLGLAAPHLEHGAAVSGGLADHPGPRTDRAGAAAAGDLPALRSEPALLSQRAVRHLVRTGPGWHRALRGDADQDLEQCAHRASIAGAGETAARGEDFRPGLTDQPAFSVQHADLDLLAHP